MMRFVDAVRLALNTEVVEEMLLGQDDIATGEKLAVSEGLPGEIDVLMDYYGERKWVRITITALN